MGHFPLVPEGLEQNEAFNWVLDILDRFDERFVAMRDDRAVAIVGVMGAQPNIEFHYRPFSWTSDRNALEAAVAYLDRHRRAGGWAIMYCERGGREHGFLTTIARTGLIRRAGTLMYHPTGPKATFEVKGLGIKS